MTGAEQVLIEDWCQQYPSHSIGSLAFGADGALYVERRRRRELQLRRLRPGRQPRSNPCGDPPAGVGGNADVRRPPRAARSGARTSARRAIPVASTARSSASTPRHGRRAARQPARRELRPERAPDRRLRAPQPVPLHLPARHERGLGRRRGLERLGGDRPPRRPARRRRRELRLAVLRGRRHAGGLRRREPRHLREPLRRGARRSHRPVLHLQPQRRRSCAARPARPELVDHRDSRSTTGGPLSGRVRRRALLRRLLARLHLGDVRRAPTACPIRRRGIDVRRRRGRPGRPRRSAPTATSSTPTSTAARSGAIQLPRLRTSRRSRRAREPDDGPARSPSTSTDRVERSGGRRRLTYAWDLDGDGAFDDSTASQPTATRTRSRGTFTAACASPTRAARFDSGADRRSRPATRRPTRRSHAPVLDDHVEGRRRRSPSPAPRPTRRTGRCPPSALSWSLVIHHCPSNCHAHHVQDFAGVASGSFTRPTTSTRRYLELDADGDRLAAASDDDERRPRPADGRAHVRSRARPDSS